jgi:PAS domain S-box-containing protein
MTSTKNQVSDGPTPLAPLDLIAKASAQLLRPPSEAESIVPTILELAHAFVAADAYAVWENTNDTEWRILASSGLSDSYQRSFTAPGPQGTPGLAHPVIIPDVFSAPTLLHRRDLYVAEKIKSLMAVPLTMGKEVRGTLTFYYRENHDFSLQEVTVAMAVANLTAVAMTTLARYRQEALENKRSEFLGEASKLLFSSLDYETTLSALTRLAVPHVADWCAVDILGENGEIQRLAIAHIDPAKVELAEEFRKLYPPTMNSESAVAKAIRGQSTFTPVVTDEMLTAACRDRRQLEMLHSLGIKSVIVVPLPGRETILGALSLVTSERVMDYSDVRFAEELGRRAALAIENARLFQALEESEQRLRKFAEAGPVLHYSNLPDGSCDYVSQKFLDFTGLAQDQVLGDGWLSAVHPDDLRGLQLSWERARLYGERHEEEFRFRRYDGVYHWFRTWNLPVRNTDGEVVRWFGTALDIEQQKLGEEALRKSEKLAAVGRLAASISHEINNPLEAVTNLVFLARNEPGVPERAQEFLSTAERELARISHVATQTLRFYRQPSRPTWTNIPELIDSLLAIYESRITNSQIEVIREYSRDVGPVQVFESELRQVIANLLVNAIDATPPGGRVLIRECRCRRWSTGERGVRITIADNGHGIEREVLSRIFEPFFTTKTNTGTGLGLWVTREIVDKHGGFIRVRSRQGRASGTVFMFFLPDVVMADVRASAS